MFIVGCRYYQGNMSPNNAEREAVGYSSAWLHHKGRNKHHLEYWIDYGIPDKEGPHKGEHKGLCGMKMPVNYVVEMYIDRVAASKNYQKEKYRDDSALAYYMNGRQFHVLHDDTRALLELLLEMLAIKGEKVTNRFIREEVLSHKIPYEKEPLLQLKEQLENRSQYHFRKKSLHIFRQRSSEHQWFLCDRVGETKPVRVQSLSVYLCKIRIV